MKNLYNFIFSIAFSAVTIFNAHAQSGSLDMTFNPGIGADDYVYATAVQSDGKILIGGSFLNYNGAAINGIARLNTNGTLDNTFNPGTGIDNSNVLSVSIETGGKIIIGGHFTSFNGTPANYLVRLNTNGTLDATFNSGGAGPNDWVLATAIQSNGQIIIAGWFSSYNGTSCPGIARLNTDGSLDNTFVPGMGGIVESVLIQTDGKILLAGANVTNTIGRLNTNGTVDNSFNPGTGPTGSAASTIYSMAQQPDGRIIIGGSFNHYNGSFINNIARINADGSIDNSFGVAYGTNDVVRTVIRQNDGKIIIGGWFTTYDQGPRNHLVRLNAVGLIDQTFNIGTGTDFDIYATALQSDGKIIIGGDFTSYNGTSRNSIARLQNTLVGIEDLENEENTFTVFPNPFTTSSTLEFKSEHLKFTDGEIIFTDLTGKVVKRGKVNSNKTEIDRGDLQSGMYFLTVTMDERKSVIKVIVD